MDNQVCESCQEKKPQVLTCDCERKVCINCVKTHADISNLECKQCHSEHCYKIEVHQDECSVCHFQKKHGKLPRPNIGWCGTGFNDALYWSKCFECKKLICSHCVSQYRCKEEYCQLTYCSLICQSKHYLYTKSSHNCM